MASIFDIPIQELIEKASEALKKDLTMPEWAKYVKTGPAKDRHPEKPDWYFKRAASLLRKVYIYGPIGVSKLRTIYGSKKNKGHKPERFLRAGGKVIRSLLQQLEQKGYIKQDAKGVHKGRVITPKGKSFMDKVVQKSHDGSRRVQKEDTSGNAQTSGKASRSAKAS